MAISVSSRIPYNAHSAFPAIAAPAPANDAVTRLALKHLTRGSNETSNAKIAAFTEVFKSRFQLVEGLVWGTCWIGLLCGFFHHINKYVRAAFEDLAQEENRTKLTIEGKELFVSFVSLSGVSASFAGWADRVRIIMLGKGALLLQKVSCASYIITAGFGIDKAICSLQKEQYDINNAQTEEEAVKHEHYYRLALIDLASHISTFAWGILGIIELCVGIAFSPVLMTSIFMLSCGLGFISLGYGLYIAFKIDPPVDEEPQIPAEAVLA